MYVQTCSVILEVKFLKGNKKLLNWNLQTSKCFKSSCTFLNKKKQQDDVAKASSQTQKLMNLTSKS